MIKKQILVVDDSVEIHPLIKVMLGAETNDVTATVDPAAGLTLAKSMRPDLILLDVDMPGMDGYEFCRRLKADASLCSVPVIFLTARGAAEQRVQGLHLGAVDYIAKPFSPGELLARANGALRTQSVIKRLQNQSLIDSLTGLGNVQMFKSRFRGEVSEQARSPRPLSCTFINVDGFRAINRSYGRPFGDHVLRKVAQAIRETYRPEDVACRVGGDHFAVLMPDTDLAAAAVLARNFRAKLSQTATHYRDSTIAITCGIGVSTTQGLYDHGLAERAKALTNSPADRPSNGLWIDDAPALAAAA